MKRNVLRYQYYFSSVLKGLRKSIKSLIIKNRTRDLLNKKEGNWAYLTATFDVFQMDL
jgi:hypothetical protein